MLATHSGTYRFSVKRIKAEAVALVIGSDRIVRAVTDITGLTSFGEQHALEGTIRAGRPLVGQLTPAWPGGQQGLGYFPTDLG